MNNYSMTRNENNKTKTTVIRTLNTLLVLIIILLVFIIASINTLWAPFTVNGPSMENTFFSDDKIIIVKRGYTLDYGDIIVFNRSDVDRKVIKRVIALPNDHIRYSRIEKAWYRNGEKLIESYVKEEYSDSYLSSTSTDIDIYSALTSQEGLLVNEGEIFVLGDNRNDSYDSHSYGAISQEAIIGKYLFKY